MAKSGKKKKPKPAVNEFWKKEEKKKITEDGSSPSSKQVKGLKFYKQALTMRQQAKDTGSQLSGREGTSPNKIGRGTGVKTQRHFHT
mmetsp:Transcript_5007/g.7493  ORF Transcript_5007/g.7493 Transcript_5007/m.7493 type:complete len:87 (+) Transcript_5007:2247-2507(+)|eukprot:CAMPEP_0170501932 /NCGR_PEP_ID=MMETSP0208-20121228/39891_1 /TAXON_ID=197538 /ORGANISM="Strombidium inclinatum, Strain S3" /LENGTH=86 /DNA_ID=CAMNT_0010780729 /DNA_START=2181 /DNA_END=2441 /DNA_ORIENTATION=+